MLKIIRRVLRLSGNLSKRIWGSFICGLLESMFGLLPIAAVFLVLIELQNGQPITGQTWGIVIGLIAGGLILRMIFKYLVYRLQSTAGFEFVARERIALGDRLRNVPMGFFHDNSVGDITATVTTDLNFLENYSMHILDKVTTGVLSMIVMAGCILAFDWRIGLIFVAGILLSFPIYSHMQKKGKALSAKRQKIQSEAVAATLEYVQGISVVKSFNMCDKNLSDIEDAYESNAAASYGVERVFTPLNMTYSMVFRISACMIMLCAGILAVGGDLSFANLAVILIASFTIFNPIEVMGQMTTMIRTMDAALDRVERIKQAKKIDENGRDIPLDSFDIGFEHVSFAYENGNPILKDVSFSIPQGSMTAIVGPSGGGKTTITRLIARFWDVQEGSITIGGHDVKEFTCDSLLKNMSMVFQNVYLFHDTIENNIKFGCPDATHEQVVEAAKKACCHDFISALPQGYDTVIGEGGSTLSGGEKQRISIARAMLKDAPIILLDEATASVDPENEVHLQQAISALVKNKTLIVIAHRLSTIRDADQILVVDNGKIVEKGVHAELIQQKGIYQKFWNIRQKARNWKLAQ
ncbi:ABC transporter ATP-binding protein [Pseudoflavonifractor sp. An85]|uniref:ABC transporter ATP-binding protein n=1 Tax=Pseudoflavonifractor sp. An85 TaxID=1965661 RepID=UPI000B37B27C|nr:ABC transporter ATP-binding protein [Pseudoflavonifractor sp. An85]OUN24553.1 multidrug ABC transporter ATP-binding protein [Pseudoflavonifractor sp. An85]